jgi:cation diffusion facilitator CzcD-associated flavoprotein CzcO
MLAPMAAAGASMGDSETTDGRSPAGRVCIIGAGVSGLVAAKVFLAAGRDIVVIEKDAEIGGVWAPGKSYPGVCTQTPRDLYCFSDFPMPADYPEWPTGAQVYRYLCAYADRFDLHRHIRLGARAVSVTQSGGGWRVEVSDPAGTRVETFAQVVITTGQFSRPRMLELPNAALFARSGGRLMHSSSYQEPALATDKDVVILGYSKSATDVAMQALAAKARSVTMVFREPVWKLPYFFGNRVNFKNILYCRASEAMFMPWAPSRLGRIARRAAAPAIWANWRALEALLDIQFGLRRLGLRPATRIEDGIHCATSIETPGFYKAVADGRIRMVRGTLASCTEGHVVTDSGESLPADLAILAIGWRQDMPFLDVQARDRLIEPDGQHRLYRMIANPDLPGLGFVGFNSSFITTLSAELGAHWLVRHFAGRLARQAGPDAMRAEIARDLAWKRELRPAASAFGGLCIAPFHFFHFDELLRDIGARRKPRNPIAAHLLPIDPKHYAALLASVPPLTLSVEDHLA